MLAIQPTPTQSIALHIERAMSYLPIISREMQAAESAMLDHDAATVTAILAEQGAELTGKQLQAFAILGAAMNACQMLAGLPPLVDTRPFIEKLESRGMRINESGAIEPIPPQVEDPEQP